MARRRTPPDEPDDGSAAYSTAALLMLQYMDATGVLEDYDSDGDDYERRPMSRVPQLQLMPGKYVRSLCDVDPTIQMLHRIGEVAEKDKVRLAPLLRMHLKDVGAETILGEPMEKAKVSLAVTRPVTLAATLTVPLTVPRRLHWRLH